MFTGLILIYPIFSNQKTHLNITSSVLIGLFQALAIMPGISRSGMTISVALIIGLNAKDAAKFSFLMAIPIISGAGFLTLLDSFNNFSIPASHCFAAIISSFLVGIFCLKVVAKLARKRKVSLFWDILCNNWFFYNDLLK